MRKVIKHKDRLFWIGFVISSLFLIGILFVLIQSSIDNKASVAEEKNRMKS